MQMSFVHCLCCMRSTFTTALVCATSLPVLVRCGYSVRCWWVVGMCGCSLAFTMKVLPVARIWVTEPTLIIKITVSCESSHIFLIIIFFKLFGFKSSCIPKLTIYMGHESAPSSSQVLLYLLYTSRLVICLFVIRFAFAIDRASLYLNRLLPSGLYLNIFLYCMEQRCPLKM